MKKTIYLFCFLSLIVSGTAYSQKYKTMADTVKLNKEHVKLSNEIVELNAKLGIAQNDLPGYQSKAKDANADAVDAASSSSDQASKATNGNVSDARTAKRKAKKAYNEAKDSRSAKNKLSDQEDKITRLNLQLKKKNQRLQDLEIMRTAINAKMVIGSPELQNH